MGSLNRALLLLCLQDYESLFIGNHIYKLILKAINCGSQGYESSLSTIKTTLVAAGKSIDGKIVYEKYSVIE